MRFLIVTLCSFASVVAAFGQASLLSSEGDIRNTGTVVIRGDATMTQPAIGGRVEYTRNVAADSQLVAQITYFDVHFEGVSEKRLSNATQVLVSQNLFSTRDEQTQLALNTASRIEARGTVVHNGIINQGMTAGMMILNGSAAQDISGNGFVPMLTLNNTSGAFVSNGGGMVVGSRLDLMNGRMQSGATDNLRMLRNAWIWRSDNASIAEHPITDERVNVKFYGSQRITGGAEFPRDEFSFQQLLVENRAGVELPWNVYVNDTMQLSGSVFTEPDVNTRYSLTFSPAFDPVYVGDIPEIDGIMVRSPLASGRTYVMNNSYTTMGFADDVAQGSVSRIELRSKPQTVPSPFAAGADKVRRFMQLRMLDGSLAVVPDGQFVVTFGYAWRSTHDNALEQPSVVETIPDLIPHQDSLVLLRFDGNEYVPEGTSQLPVTVSTAGLWRHSQSVTVTRNGEFAIGLSRSAQAFILYARLLLEGSMRQRGDNVGVEMANDLRQRNLVPPSPPREYPYTLDPLSQSIVVPVMPDSVVDWMIVELRSEAGGGVTHFRTVLLTRSGFLIDPVTANPVLITGVQPGDYYLVFRHRNHLAVMTETREFVDRTNTKFFDLTSGTGIFGGAAAQRVVGTENGRRIFALIGGDVSNDGEVLRPDQHDVWTQRNIEGYTIYDTDMDGIISTADWNLSWNNRGRSSAVPR